MGKIFFQHIPKTGGTSLVYAAQRLFGEAVCPARYDYQLSEQMITSDKYAFYHGHFTFAALVKFRSLNPDAFIFTLLRHPFSRTLSQYYNWIDRDKVRNEFAAIAAASTETDHIRALREKFETTIFDMSLADFLRTADADISQVVTNLQAQFLTEIEVPNHQRFNKAALNLINYYDFVGLSELFVESAGIVEAKCQLPPGSLANGALENVGEGRLNGAYHVSGEEFDLLQRCNSYDLVLFHLAHALLLRDFGGRMPVRAFDAGQVAVLPSIVG